MVSDLQYIQKQTHSQFTVSAYYITFHYYYNWYSLVRYSSSGSAEPCLTGARSGFSESGPSLNVCHRPSVWVHSVAQKHCVVACPL